ncbi:SH3 domain-containing protein [Lachnospiraceae bacterium 29-84]
MWKKTKLLFATGIMLFIFMISGNLGSLETIEASSLSENEITGNEVYLQIVSYNAEKNESLAIVRQNPNGQVIGDGVRLRSTPSTSGTILEKMYYNEYVIVRGRNNDWYNIQRVKTGTVGWASCNYILLL